MKRVTAAQKHRLMTKLLATTRGRQRIAASMQEPLRRLRDFVSNGRKALFVDLFMIKILTLQPTLLLRKLIPFQQL